MFFAAWLAAWWLGLGIVLGALANRWVHRAHRRPLGRRAASRVTRALARRLPWLLLLLVPLLFGVDALYPWVGEPTPTPGARRWPGRRSAASGSSPAFVAARVVVLRARLVAAGAAGANAVATAAERRPRRRVAADPRRRDVAGRDRPADVADAGLVQHRLRPARPGRAAASPAAPLTIGCRRARRPRDRPADEPARAADLARPRQPAADVGAELGLSRVHAAAHHLGREPAARDRLVPAAPADRLGRGRHRARRSLHFALPLLALLLSRGQGPAGSASPVVAFALLAANALDVAWLVLPSVAPHSLHGWWLAAAAARGDGPAALRRPDRVGSRRDCRADAAKRPEAELRHAALTTSRCGASSLPARSSPAPSRWSSASSSPA